MISLYHKERWHLFFIKNDVFSDEKWKKIFLKKIQGNIISPVYLLFGFYFSYRYEVTLLSKKIKYHLLPQNTNEYGIPDITKKNDTHPIKDDVGDILERVLVIFGTFIEIVLSVFIYCFPMKKIYKGYYMVIWLYSTIS